MEKNLVIGNYDPLTSTWSIVAKIPVDIESVMVSTSVSVMQHIVVLLSGKTGEPIIFRCKTSTPMKECNSESWGQDVIPPSFPLYLDALPLLDSNTLLTREDKGFSIWRYSDMSQSWGLSDQLDYPGKPGLMAVNQKNILYRSDSYLVAQPTMLFQYSLADGKFYAKYDTITAPLLDFRFGLSLDTGSKFFALGGSESTSVYMLDANGAWVLFQSIVGSSISVPKYAKNSRFVIGDIYGVSMWDFVGNL